MSSDNFKPFCHWLVEAAATHFIMFVVGCVPVQGLAPPLPGNHHLQGLGWCCRCHRFPASGSEQSQSDSPVWGAGWTTDWRCFWYARCDPAETDREVLTLTDNHRQSPQHPAAWRRLTSVQVLPELCSRTHRGSDFEPTSLSSRFEQETLSSTFETQSAIWGQHRDPDQDSGWRTALFLTNLMFFLLVSSCSLLPVYIYSSMFLMLNEWTERWLWINCIIIIIGWSLFSNE